MRVLFVVLVAMTSLPCLAQEPAPVSWHRQHLGDYTSAPGEALPDFLKRTGRSLQDHTRQSGHEACAAIASDGERFSFRLYTDGVPHGCAVRTSEVLEGFAFTGDTLHSHPAADVLQLDATARAWSKAHGLPLEFRIQNDGARGFSRTDFAGGPGWLVAGGQLWHQTGAHRVRKHGPLARQGGQE